MEMLSYLNEKEIDLTDEMEIGQIIKFCYLGDEMFIISSQNSICILSMKYKNKVIFKLPLEVNNNLAFCYYLNRLYIINNIIDIHMIDINIKTAYKLIIDDESQSIPIKSAYSFYDTKIYYTGGLINNKISSDIFSYDISTYKFEKEKIRENNMIPRHSHSSIVLYSYLHIVGGYISAESENDSKITETIQMIQVDNYFNTWIDVKIQGDKPVLMIHPILKQFKEEYLLSFSDYKYPKIWLYNITDHVGRLYSLTLTSRVHDINLINENIEFVQSLSEKKYSLNLFNIKNFK